MQSWKLKNSNGTNLLNANRMCVKKMSARNCSKGSYLLENASEPKGLIELPCFVFKEKLKIDCALISLCYILLWSRTMNDNNGVLQ